MYEQSLLGSLKFTRPKLPPYDIDPEMLELWGMRTTLSLTFLQGPSDEHLQRERNFKTPKDGTIELESVKLKCVTENMISVWS